eukprot:14053994-Alexandrium_andersonii.AAC.1
MGTPGGCLFGGAEDWVSCMGQESEAESGRTGGPARSTGQESEADSGRTEGPVRGTGWESQVACRQQGA